MQQLLCTIVHMNEESHIDDSAPSYTGSQSVWKEDPNEEWEGVLSTRLGDHSIIDWLAFNNAKFLCALC